MSNRENNMEELQLDSDHCVRIIQEVIDKYPQWDLQLQIRYEPDIAKPKNHAWWVRLYSEHRSTTPLRLYRGATMNEALHTLALWVAGGGISRWKVDLDQWFRENVRTGRA
jgi:hypothetical protein